MIDNAPASTTYVEPLERAESELTLLAVGVDESTRDSIGSALESRDRAVEVHTASTAADAMERLSKQSFDCVISGGQLPDGGGLEFYGRVIDVHGDLPFVLCPSEPDDGLAAEAINAGVDGYQPRTDASDDFEELAERIAAVVDEHQSRERLTETTRMLLRLTEYTNDTLWMFSGDWEETVIVNSAYQEVWDRSIDDLVTNPSDFLEGVHPADEDHVLAGMEQLSTGESADLEYRIEKEDEVRWVSVHAEPVFDPDGNIEYVAGFTRDIDELKTRELTMQSLNGASTQLLHAREKAEVADIVVDIADSIIGCPLTIVRCLDDDGVDLVPMAATDEVVASSETTETATLTHVSPGHKLYDVFEDGTTDLIEDDAMNDVQLSETAIGSLLVVPLGNQGLLSVGTGPEQRLDDYERHLLEILAGTATAAFHRVERDQELSEYREELEQSNENLQQFAYVASHDLQEPLRMVASYVDLLESEYGDQFDNEAREYMDYAIDGARRMQDMIDALLQYARVQTRGGDFTEVHTESVFEDTVDSLRMRIDEADATVEYDSMPTVEGDANQIGQVFQNLLENAITYASQSDTDPHVEVTTTRDDDVIRFSVADDGPGIPERQQDRIFEIFERNTDHDDGTGIGLAICQRIIRRHGGDLWVESDGESGSTFMFTIPTTTTEAIADD